MTSIVLNVSSPAAWRQAVSPGAQCVNLPTHVPDFKFSLVGFGWRSIIRYSMRERSGLMAAVFVLVPGIAAETGDTAKRSRLRRSCSKRIFSSLYNECVPTCAGEMAEWLKAHAWKACLGETLTWVRIPLSPPPSSISSTVYAKMRTKRLKNASAM